MEIGLSPLSGSRHQCRRPSAGFTGECHLVEGQELLKPAYVHLERHTTRPGLGQGCPWMGRTPPTRRPTGGGPAGWGSPSSWVTPWTRTPPAGFKITAPMSVGMLSALCTVEMPMPRNSSANALMDGCRRMPPSASYRRWAYRPNPLTSTGATPFRGYSMSDRCTFLAGGWSRYATPRKARYRAATPSSPVHRPPAWHAEAMRTVAIVSREELEGIHASSLRARLRALRGVRNGSTGPTWSRRRCRESRPSSSRTLRSGERLTPR